MTFLPGEDRRYLDERGIAYKEIEDGGIKGIIIQGYRLPDGRFDHDVADVLIIIPSNYPDAAPDMFHTMPWVKVVSTSSYPIRADQPVTFAGQNWQRWSRHADSWRPGKDGIWTVLKRVEHAIEVAA